MSSCRPNVNVKKLFFVVTDPLDGATAFNTMTLDIMAFGMRIKMLDRVSIKGSQHYCTQHNDIQNNDTQHNFIQQNAFDITREKRDTKQNDI